MKVRVSVESLGFAVRVAEFIELHVDRTCSVGVYCFLIGLLIGYERARRDAKTRELV